MTTTVTIKTHDWPVAATVNTNTDFDDGKTRVYGHSSRTEFVPPNTERDFHISSGTSISFNELPKEAQDLNYGRAEANIGANSVAGASA